MIKQTLNTAKITCNALRATAITLMLLTLSACGSDVSGLPAVPFDDAPSTTGGDDGTGNGETSGASGDGASDSSTGTDDGTSGNPDNTDGTGTGGTTEISANQVLAPLPSPPLTAAPGADSEPVRASGDITTITEFFPVREARPATPNTYGVLTDEDFAAGPLPAVIKTPSHVDTTTNSPPYFDNLSDAEVIVGQELTMVIKPRDPDDQGVPGLIAEGLPAAANYVDNFNGGRDFSWRPLQPDVGIHEFNVIALDPLEPYYQTIRTVRIKVSMPSDPSTITNYPPVVNLIRDSTVQVNDPVVLYIKVDDVNGTVPTLEIVNPPAGATITPHYDVPKYTILQFTPTAAGIITLDLIARDEIDPSLSVAGTATINVLEESAFIRPGARLRELAAERDLLIGYAAKQRFYEQPDGAIYTQIAGEEFNFVSSENAMKWGGMNPIPGEYHWAQADNLVAQAKASRQAIHGHTLIWHRQIPAWIQFSEPQEREAHMREYIDRVLTRYADDVPIWDVVNEALEEDGTFRESVWFDSMGAQFIDTAFRQSRATAPNATLLYNEYGVSTYGPKADGLIALMQSLKDANTPVDGVGLQMHLRANFDSYDETRAIFQTIADLDLDIYITELDVSIVDDQTEEQQAKVYAEVLSVCLEQPRCKAYQIWGFTDQHSWRDFWNPLILDRQYQVKPAYLAIQKRLMEN